MKASQNDRPGQFSDAKRTQMLRQVRNDASGRVRLFERIFSDQASPREAIKGQCLACCWMDEAAIGEGCATACPLWDFRPFKG